MSVFHLRVDPEDSLNEAPLLQAAADLPRVEVLCKLVVTPELGLLQLREGNLGCVGQLGLDGAPPKPLLLRFLLILLLFHGQAGCDVRF